jgi:hypothetical protein
VDCSITILEQDVKNRWIVAVLDQSDLARTTETAKSTKHIRKPIRKTALPVRSPCNGIIFGPIPNSAIRGCRDLNGGHKVQEAEREDEIFEGCHSASFIVRDSGCEGRPRMLRRRLQGKNNGDIKEILFLVVAISVPHSL